MISYQELIEQFTYDPLTGEFKRFKYRDRHGNPIKCNYTIKGDNGIRGYKRVSINGERYLLHKLVFLYMEGYYPNEEVDHINGITSDNAYDNLRVVGRQENRKNLKKYKNNTTGFTGVGIKNGKYFAQIQCDGISYFKGYFDNEQEAVVARQTLERELMFHINHGENR